MTGGNGRVGGFRVSDSCERLVICEECEAGVTGTHSGKCCLIFASVRCRTLLVSNSSTVAMSVCHNGVEGDGKQGLIKQMRRFSRTASGMRWGSR